MNIEKEGVTVSENLAQEITEMLRLCELVLCDLARAQRMMLRAQDDIKPQYRIATPEGDYYAAPSLAGGVAERLCQINALQWLMSWKRAFGYVMAAGLRAPDAIFAIGVTPVQVVGAIAGIVRRNGAPVGFEEPCWLTRSQIGDEMTDLLPREPQTLTPEMFRAIELHYGATGKFPVMRISDGQIGF
jgi:hypothetical protein